MSAGMLRPKIRPALALALAAAIGALTVVQPASAMQVGQSAQGGIPSPLGAAPANTGVIDRVLVRVSGRAILYSDFEAQLQDRLNVIAAQVTQEQIDAQLPLLRMSLMVGLVQEAVMEIRAEDLGIGADPNEIDRAIQNIRETNGLLDDNQWSQALAQSGLTEAQLRENIAGSIVQQRMVQQEIQRQVFVSQREVATYYDEHPEDFTEPEQVLYQQIILVYQGADRAPVRERAENALTELRAGISLSAVGNKYATPSDVVQDAAEATWVAPEDIQEEVRQVINELSPLTYSEIVEGRYGYHIIQLMDRKEGRLAPLDEAAGGIRNFLTDQKMTVKLDEYTAEIIDNVNLEIYAEEFADLRNALQAEVPGAPGGTPGR